MKKILIIAISAVLLVSCSENKKVVISGKIVGASPTDRIEIVEMTGVATLPIANFGVDNEGNFVDTISIPKNGVYTISYGGNYGVVYLKSGYNIKLQGNANGFPRVFTAEGDAADNIFLQKVQTFTDEYFSKIGQQQDIVTQEESKFINQIQKIRADLGQEMDNLSMSNGVEKKLVKWKKTELDMNLLMFSGRYANVHGQLSGKPDYKPSQELKDFQKDLVGNENENIKDFPIYRSYLIGNIGNDFQEYKSKDTINVGLTTTEVFINYIKDKDEYSQLVKDYLISFVAGVDLNPDLSNPDEFMKSLDKNIKDSYVKKGLKKIESAIFGPKMGASAPKVNFLNIENKKVSSKSFIGKPTLIMFYASWNQHIYESLVPMIKDIVSDYKEKVNFVQISLDDSFQIFKKTSDSLLKDLDGQKLYVERGLNSDISKKYNLYGFKLPSFLILDKEGKVASKTFINNISSEFKTVLDKVSGVVSDIVKQEEISNTDKNAEEK